MAMSIEFNCVELEDFFSHDAVQQSGITVWVFLRMMNSGKITRGIDKGIISMAIEEVYREIVGDVLKEVQPATRSLLVPDLFYVESLTVLIGVHAGLSVEERPVEEKLEGALVHIKAKQTVLLHRGRPQGVPRQHNSGWELLCGGTVISRRCSSFNTPDTKHNYQYIL